MQMNRPLALLSLLSVFSFAPACDDEETEATADAGGVIDAAVSEVAAEGGIAPEGGSDGGTGTGTPGVLQFPMDVALVTFGKPNYIGAVDTDISIHSVELDYDRAYEANGDLIQKDRIFTLLSRNYASPGDSPPGQAIPFWWAVKAPDGSIKGFVCHEDDAPRGHVIDRRGVLNGLPEPIWATDCSWELVLRANAAKVEYAIRAPSVSGFLLGFHGNAGGTRVAVGSSSGTGTQYFRLISPGAATQ